MGAELSQSVPRAWNGGRPRGAWSHAGQTATSAHPLVRLSIRPPIVHLPTSPATRSLSCAGDRGQQDRQGRAGRGGRASLQPAGFGATWGWPPLGRGASPGTWVTSVRSPIAAPALPQPLPQPWPRHSPGPCPSPCRRPAQPQSDSPGPGPSSYPVRGPRHAGPREAGEARGSPAWPSPAGTGRSPGVRGTRPGRPRCSRPRPAGSGPRGGRPGPGSTAGRGRLRPGHTPVPAALAGAVHAVTQPAPQGGH